MLGLAARQSPEATGTDPEKYNLYNGLTEMARAIQYIDREVSEIKLAVDRIIRNR